MLHPSQLPLVQDPPCGFGGAFPYDTTLFQSCLGFHYGGPSCDCNVKFVKVGWHHDGIAYAMLLMMPSV